MSPVEKVEFQGRVIEWYKASGRRYAWRDGNDPFCLLVAEVLLRLTGAWKVERVYEVLMQRYASPEELAAVDPSDLRQLLRPLGLHARAELLVDISKEIVARFGGGVPDVYDDLVGIKGIGPYTANAILCFCFGRRVPVVDGSVKRLFGRCFGYASPRPAYADKRLWELAESLLPESECREYNFGLLDLAAMVCRFRAPDCGACPIRHLCRSPGGNSAR